MDGNFLQVDEKQSKVRAVLNVRIEECNLLRTGGHRALRVLIRLLRD